MYASFFFVVVVVAAHYPQLLGTMCAGPAYPNRKFKHDSYLSSVHSVISNEIKSVFFFFFNTLVLLLDLTALESKMFPGC